MTSTKTSKTTSPRGMGQIIPNGRGGFTFRYRGADGKQHQETYSTKALAQDRQAQLWRDKRAGELTFTDKSAGAVMFLDYAARWIERGQSRGESTKILYRQTLKRIAGKLEGRSLAWVATHRAEVEDVINGLKTEPKGASYVRRARQVIVGACNTAQKNGDLPNGHALRGLDIGKDVRVTPASFYAASHAQLEAMASAMGEPYSLLVWTGRYAGLRIGESLGLNRSDIMTGTDGGKLIVLKRQRIQDGSLTPLKARQVHDFRQIPIDAWLADKLATAPVDAEGYYFPVAWRKTIQDRFNAARDQAGLPASFTPHDLRHLYASALLSAGARLDLVSKILGHGSVEITSAVYAHVMPTDYGTLRNLVSMTRAA